MTCEYVRPCFIYIYLHGRDRPLPRMAAEMLSESLLGGLERGFVLNLSITSL